MSTTDNMPMLLVVRQIYASSTHVLSFITWYTDRVAGDKQV